MTRFVFTASVLLVLTHALYAQTGNTQDSLTDSRDGKKYKTIKIGDQVWMAENLNYDAGDGSTCYENNSANCGKYGMLYTWEAAKKSAPAGWHLPSKSEYDRLVSFLGGDEKKVHQQLVEGGPSKFNALFGGYRAYRGSYEKLGNYSYFWSATEGPNPKSAWSLIVISSNTKKSYLYYEIKTFGMSVRCVKD